MDTTPPQAEEWWRVVEVYGVHRLVGGIQQVVARERTHGPYKTYQSAKYAMANIESRRNRMNNPMEISGIYTIEKGTIQWQEN